MEIVMVYVLQEIGTDAIRHEKAIDTLRTHEELWKPVCALKEGRRHSTLLESMWHSRNKECADERELVYSSLSISGKDKVDTGPKVRMDYTCCRSELALDVSLAHTAGICLFSVAITLRALRSGIALISNEETARALLILNHLLLQTKDVTLGTSNYWKISHIAPAKSIWTRYHDLDTGSGVELNMTEENISLILSFEAVCKLSCWVPVEDIFEEDNIQHTCEVYASQEACELELAKYKT
jgi:hypothetical protein